MPRRFNSPVSVSVRARSASSPDSSVRRARSRSTRLISTIRAPASSASSPNASQGTIVARPDTDW